MSSYFRGFLLGLVLPAALGLPILAFGLQYVPDSPLIGTLARMLESAAPQLLVCALVPVALCALLGARRTALAGLALVVVVAGALAVQHRMRTLPAVAPSDSDLTLIWFNTLFTNRTPSATIIKAIRDSGADVVMLAETARVGPALDGLRDTYPYQVGCIDACEVYILSRYPLDVLGVYRPGKAWPERMIIARVLVPGQTPLTLVGLHMAKPWFYGITDEEEDVVERRLRPLAGPLVLAGDLNSAPWSARLRWLNVSLGLTDLRWPIATWPVEAGPAGIPIDHILVRGGVRVVSVEPWGDALGSDHRGLKARLSLPSPRK